jgi:RHS repeat-associated protein
MGARVGITDSLGMRSLRRLGASVLASVLGSGLAHYTPGTSERQGGESRFFHAGIKSFDAQTDESGSVAATRRYDAFGNTLAGGWTSPFAHGGPWGYQTDANGLQLLGHRYYDPTLGRFLTRDPAEDGRNHHTYCWNNPVSGVDPDGFQVLPLFRLRTPFFGNWNHIWIRGVRFDRSGSGSSKTFRLFIKHWRLTRQARQDLAELYIRHRNSTSHREKAELLQAIRKKEKEIRGHEKEMDQKWGGWRNESNWDDIEAPSLLPPFGSPHWSHFRDPLA